MRELGIWIGAASDARPRQRRSRREGGFQLSAPREGQLSLVGPVALELQLPPSARKSSLELRVDGVVFPVDGFELRGRTLRGGARRARRRPPPARARGPRASTATRSTRGSSWSSWRTPSSARCSTTPRACFRSRRPASSSALTRVPATASSTAPDALPVYNRLEVPLQIPPDVLETKRADPTPYLQNDGFSPTVQVLMNFPRRRRPGALGRGAPRPRPRAPTARAASTPTARRCWSSSARGTRVNHWIENDARVPKPERAGSPSCARARRCCPAIATSWRCGTWWTRAATPVEAEPVFAAIRDGRPSDIPAVEATRRRLEPRAAPARGARRRARGADPRLRLRGVERPLAHARDALDARPGLRVARRAGRGGRPDLPGGRGAPAQRELRRRRGRAVWRELRGSFQAPLFLERAIPSAHAPDARLPAARRAREAGLDDAHERSLRHRDPVLGVRPDGSVRPQPTLLLGHGLFGNGLGLVREPRGGGGPRGFDFVAGATNFSGLSSPDVGPNLLDSFIVRVIADVDQFEALPDRLRQGQLHRCCWRAC